jgi:hypothetical protein
MITPVCILDYLVLFTNHCVADHDAHELSTSDGVNKGMGYCPSQIYDARFLHAAPSQ